MTEELKAMPSVLPGSYFKHKKRAIPQSDNQEKEFVSSAHCSIVQGCLTSHLAHVKTIRLSRHAHCKQEFVDLLHMCSLI